MSSGFFGKILWVDLTNETFEEEELPEELYRQYLGGYGLGCYLIYKYMSPKIDALSPESIFGFFPGLLTGTAAAFSGRYMVCGKSPLTGTWGDSNSGGTYGPSIKKCGYDAILFKGAAKTPKYIAIIDDKKEILDASDIWGLDIVEAEAKLKEKHGNAIKTAGIGKAGENMSLISGIANDKGRIAARSGLGAIMGSKKLKMLVLKGNKKIPFHDKETYMQHVIQYNKGDVAKEPGRMMSSMMKMVPGMAKMMRRFGISMSAGGPGMIRTVYKLFGTCVGNTMSAETGDSPIKNWSGIGMYDFPLSMSKELSANKIHSYAKRKYGCVTCPIMCGAILSVPEIGIEETHLPEYETCSSFGAMLLNNDLLSVLEINEMCNRAAIDTISTGGTVAFAIECYENGILTKEDTGGLELNWGNSKAIVELVKKIINRDGIGDILADGSKKAAEKIGKGSEKYAMTSLGQEIAQHNPRIFDSLGFTYAFDPTPGRHTAASVDFIDIGPIDNYVEGFELPKKRKKDIDKKYEAQKLTTGIHQVISSAGLCMFSNMFGKYPMLELINSLTSWDITIDELIEIGLRIQNLRQAFTLREGVEIAKNKLPGRVYGEPPDEKGPTKGITVDYEGFYKGYCGVMGWNPENGYPLEETLKNLNLEFVMKDLY